MNTTTRSNGERLREAEVGCAGPLLPDVGVIALVPDVWEEPWQPRHYVLSRLAQYFHVVWCDRPYDWRGALQLDGRPDRAGTDDIRSPGFVVRRPARWLPFVGRVQVVGDWTLRRRLQRAAQTLREHGCQTIVLYIWRPEYARALDLIDHDLSCYHIDDEYTFSPVEQPISDRERRLIAASDLVFMHSPALLEKKAFLNRSTTFVPNGVDYDAYASPQPEPDDLRSIPRPRVGYVGRIKDQLDLPLLTTLVRRHPGWSFVFVGPHANRRTAAEWTGAFSGHPNVHFLGEKAVGELPAYTQHLDVCTMCYVTNGYTKFIYPLKLHEYLAAGRPVVATPIRSLGRFSDVIELASTADEWSDRLTHALSAEALSPAAAHERRRVAREYDWKRLVGTIAYLMCRRLGPSFLARIRGTTDAHAARPVVLTR